MADQAYPSRPPLYRGNTVPLYVRTPSSSTASGQEQLRVHAEGGGAPYSANPDRYKSLGPRPGDMTLRRDQMGYAPASASSSARAGHHWQIGALPPTPPLSTSPGSAESYQEAYFPPVQGSAPGYPQSGARHQKSNAHQQPLPYVSSPLSPTVSSPTVTEGPSSFQLLRSTRGPTPQHNAKMRIDNTSTEYILSAAIGPGFDSNCITIAARKGNILDIVADRWDCEKDCHHEWQVQFDRDADMGGVRASYTDGVLTVTVKRLNYASPHPPQMRT